MQTKKLGPKARKKGFIPLRRVYNHFPGIDTVLNIKTGALWGFMDGDVRIPPYKDFKHFELEAVPAFPDAYITEIKS